MKSNLETLQHLDTPVSVDSFIEKFTVKFQQWNSITPALQETWKLNCLALNNAVHNKDKAIKYIVSAPTGSAKTENTITYCSMLPVGIKALISTNLIDEANRLAEGINKEAERVLACAFHSKSTLSIDEAAKHQVVIVSHEFYRRHYMGDHQWYTLGEDRDLIIIDEALDTMKEISVSSDEISRAITVFTNLSSTTQYSSNAYFKKELKRLQDELQVLMNFSKGTKLIRSNTLWSIPREGTENVQILSIETDSFMLFQDIIENDENIKYNYILTGTDNTSEDGKIKTRILQTLIDLDSLKGRQTYITANRGTYSFNRVVDSTPNKSLVCFDATADVNKAYDLRAKHYNDLIKVPKVPNVRDYSAATIHTAIANTGKEAISIDVASTILTNVRLGDKTLIVTHKSNESFFKELASTLYPMHIIEVAHWNALTGLNQWQDFDTCIIAGLNHKPKSFSQNRVIVNTNESIAFGEKQNSLNTAITETDLVAEIVQAINRIRVRKIITDTGGCASANIYITVPVLNNEVFKQLIQAQMCGINIIDWDLPEVTTSKENIGHFDSVLVYLRGTMKAGDKISINAPRDALKIKSESYRNVVGKTVNDKEEFKEKLLQYGFEVLEISETDSRGRTKKKNNIYIHCL